jgi:Xaa-Pro aminopeptidase
MISYPDDLRYTTEERDRRWDQAHDVMRQVGAGVLVVYGDREGVGPAPFAPDVYFTNDRPGSIVVFFADEAQPYQLVFAPMAISDHLQSTDRGEDVWVAADHVAIGRNAPFTADLVKQHGADRGTVAVVGLEPYAPFYFNGALPHRLASGLAAQLPEATIEPAWFQLAARMATLSGEQQRVLRYCAAVGDEMVNAMVDAATPGRTQADLVAAAMQASYGNGGASPYIVLNSDRSFVNWGPPAWLYRPQPPRRLAPGDVVLAEVFSTVAMVETQHQVAIAVGELDPRYDELVAACEQAYRAGVERAGPGTTFGDVVEAMRRPIDDAGWSLTPVVHGLNPILLVAGCSDHLDRLPGANRYRQLGAIPTIGAETPLTPGMTLALEPDCLRGDLQMNLGSTILITETGAEELSTRTNTVIRGTDDGRG